MLRSHKIALSPTAEQVLAFFRNCGYARFTFNFALSDFKDGLANGEWRSWKTLNTRFNARKDEFDWCRANDQRAGLFGIAAVWDAVDRWRSGQNRFPKHKRRNARQSDTTNNDSLRVDGKRIRLPKIGWVWMHQKLRWTGEIVRVTISRRAHRWFVAILVKTEDTPKVADPAHPVIGVDVGINTLATLSTGEKYDNPRPLQRYEKKLAREQRKLSRKQYLSNNWFKQKRRVERLHYRIACIREAAQWRCAVGIVRSAQVIGIETLKVSNLLKNRNIAKALSDSALGGLLTKIKAKADQQGRLIVEAPQFFASSKTCSSCGAKKEKLSLSERTYHCEECGQCVDRDVNAAINLRNLAVGLTESLNACGV